MRYVLDASVATSWVIPRPLSAKALRLRADYQKVVHELIAPAHFPHEVASALTKAERQKLIPVGDADALIRDVLSTSPVLYDIDPILYRAVAISSQLRSAFYDVLYVALAEREGCELVTADDKLVNNLQKHFPSSCIWRPCPRPLPPSRERPDPRSYPARAEFFRRPLVGLFQQPFQAAAHFRGWLLIQPLAKGLYRRRSSPRPYRHRGVSGAAVPSWP